MILLGLLVATTLITLSKSTPLPYATYRTRGLNDDDEGVYIPYLIDGSSVNDIFWPPIPQETTIKVVNNSALGIDRVKKIRSLSVTNSLDVLRQRVLLELARRKALQDQKQIDANRRFLDNIGKRSSFHVDSLLPHSLETNNEQIFQRTNNIIPKNSLYRNNDWYNNGQEANDDEQTDQMERNELRLL